MPDQEQRNRLGGMALANGLLVHGPEHWAAAVRDDEGEIHVASGEKPRLKSENRLAKLPLVRGIVRLGEALMVVPVVRRGMPEARLAFEEGPVGVAAVGSLALAAAARRRLPSVLAQEAVGAAAGLIPALVAIRSSDAAIWHGVEHKSIAAYERGGADGVSQAAAERKEHERCGTNLILPLLVTTTLGNAAVRRGGRRPGPLTRIGVAAMSLGVAVEAFAFAARRPENPFSRAIHGFGHAVQSGFSTREPGEAELEIGRKAMDELLRVER